MNIGKFYTWENIDGKIWEGVLLERRDNWLQFVSYDPDMNDFDGFMMINSDILRNFFEIPMKENVTKIIPTKSLNNQSFSEIMKNGLLVEIVGTIDYILEDEGDLFFEEGEFRFYPILKDGTYENGYLPMQEENIVSIYYDNEYLKKLEILAKEQGTW